ncbi:rhamnan synthesis F family protein [Lactococcus garvieae]|uniref:rhamnan synthesis F family protein n=1 Tax=Lactococcus garvieae TaxID=1363 RepID=UPI00021CCBD1|nr:rhamnan synthesis F family protein [Lactococcus garvieae]EOT31416.1 rhamnosyltransferase [Lactococcus garvieae ATCC 49156]EOT94319.1 rhamnosyltransferase [Lactococcus garvieae ATCC 49156]BAK57633.1 rhamnosyltransferase [Lactococcus garvieae ATCC 49156]
MKRLLLYVHYNKYNQISDHVLYQLRQMKPLFEKVVFISNSYLSVEGQAKLTGLIDDFIQRENKGFDFGAWRDGMEYIGFEQLKEYDSVTIMNDTCFGPLYDMVPYYAEYEAREVDIWGITNHRDYQESKNHGFAEHIQSYYKVFSHKVISSEVFQNFWKNIEDFENVQDVIDHYEIRSTTVFIEAGFKYETILDTRELDDSRLLHPDFSYYAPDVILREKVPFLKVKAFQSNESAGIAKFMLDYVGENTNYQKELIVAHLSSVDYPDANYLLAEKYLGIAQHQIITNKIAVHLHVFYPELLEEFMAAFAQFHFDYSLYLTTNTEEKELIIQKYLVEHQIQAELVRTANYGRDVMPFLALKEKLRQYDIIGHFHTKRSLEASFFAGESWRTELIDMLIKPADNIIRNFEENDKLGIVIADIPSFFRFNRVVDADNENKMIAPIMNDMWKRMKMRKKINFHDFKIFTMSYGTFFWAKTEVLEPLFDLEIMKKEVPNEPLPQNTILHAIERILIYLAWDKDLDFRISKNHQELSPFIDARTFNQRFGITEENAKDIRLTFVLKLAVKKTLRLIKYRTYKLLGKDTTHI